MLLQSSDAKTKGSTTYCGSITLSDQSVTFWYHLSSPGTLTDVIQRKVPGVRYYLHLVAGKPKNVSTVKKKLEEYKYFLN